MALSRGAGILPRGTRMWGFVSLLDFGSVTALQGADLVGAAVGAFVFVIIVLILLFASLKVVKEYERIVNFRLGKAQAEKGPGIVVVIPGIDKPVRVDLRERYLTIPHQTCITKDNAPVDVDFIVYFKVASAADSVIRVNNFEGAAMGIATTTLRAVIGDIILDEVLSKREEINAILRTKLDEKTLKLQYLYAHRALGASPATKFILPLEFTELIRPFRGVLASAEGAAKGDDR